MSDSSHSTKFQFVGNWKTEERKAKEVGRGALQRNNCDVTRRGLRMRHVKALFLSLSKLGEFNFFFCCLSSLNFHIIRIEQKGEKCREESSILLSNAIKVLCIEGTFHLITHRLTHSSRASAWKNVKHATKREERNEEKICDLHLADLRWAAAAILTLMWCQVWNGIFFCSELMKPIWRGKSKFYSEKTKKHEIWADMMSCCCCCCLYTHDLIEGECGVGGWWVRIEKGTTGMLDTQQFYALCCFAPSHFSSDCWGAFFFLLSSLHLIARIALLFTSTHTSLLSFLFLWAPSNRKGEKAT